MGHLAATHTTSLPEISYISCGQAIDSNTPGRGLLLDFLYCVDLERALEDLNPRHQVLETCVLPTELRAHGLPGAVDPNPSLYSV